MIIKKNRYQKKMIKKAKRDGRVEKIPRRRCIKGSFALSPSLSLFFSRTAFNTQRHRRRHGPCRESCHALHTAIDYFLFPSQCASSTPWATPTDAAPTFSIDTALCT